MDILDETVPYIDLTIADIILSVVVLAVGFALTKLIVRTFKKGMGRSKLPDLVVDFLSRFLNVLLLVAVLLMFFASLGVEVDSVVLGLSAVIGLIFGFGMQDTLTNLSSGVWIAALRPLDKGDYVDVSGHSGTVEAVGLMATELITPDNKMVTVPNKLIWNSSIVNYTRLPTRRADVNVGISYKADLDRAIKLAIDLMTSHPLVLEDPAPSVIVTGLGDSSVDLQLRPWTANADLWSVKWELNGEIFKLFTREGIEIPYPQRDVHIRED